MLPSENESSDESSESSYDNDEGNDECAKTADLLNDRLHLSDDEDAVANALPISLTAAEDSTHS